MNQQTAIENRQSKTDHAPPFRVLIYYERGLRYEKNKLAEICAESGIETTLSSALWLGLGLGFCYQGCDLGIILRETTVTVSIPGRRAVIFNLDLFPQRSELAAEFFKELGHPDPARQRKIYGLTLAAIGLMQLATLPMEAKNVHTNDVSDGV